jgi:hypothetical protein
MKEMIDAGNLPQWSHRKSGNHMIYRYAISATDAPSEATGGLVLLRAQKQRPSYR